MVRHSTAQSRFHGWHDWHLQTALGGLPNRDPEVLDFGYDLPRLEKLLEVRASEVACVILTPEVAFYPHDYHVQLERLVHEYGCLLVLDEVMTGFRYALGGYSSAVGLQPDLITVSKGLANGFALSAALGRADIFEGPGDAYFGSTYQREVTPFAAATASLKVFTSTDPTKTMRAAGAQLIQGLNRVFDKFSVPAVAFGWPSMFRVLFCDDNTGHAFYGNLVRRGVLMEYRGVHMISAATTDDDLDYTLQAVEASLVEMERTELLPERDREIHDDDAYALASRAFGASEDSVRAWWPGFHIGQLAANHD